MNILSRIVAWALANPKQATLAAVVILGCAVCVIGQLMEAFD